jgi:N-acetyl-gamma-glutamyl-phosphate reductase
MGRTTVRVGVVGASGYGGTELLRLLEAHPVMTATVIAARSRAGEPVRSVAPNLRTDALLEDVDPVALGALDVVFLATPHEASLELAPDLVDRGVPVIDLSGAFRLSAADHAEWYGGVHPAPELAADGGRAAVYGLTEWSRAELPGAHLVANPGCYPTATVLALAPLAGLIEAGSVVVDAKSGTSGAGRSTADALSASTVLGDLVAYGAPRHRHTREIETAIAGASGIDIGAIGFTPHLVPMSRGLLSTCSARVRDGVGPDDLRAALVDRYAHEGFVDVLPAGEFPRTKALAGSNGCRIGLLHDPRAGRVVVTGAIDNLGKGAAGQAIQNANVLLGLDEGAGLTAIGMHP